MNVAVVGSFQSRQENKGRSHKKEKGRRIFEIACKAIGKALGDGNHQMMVAHRYDKHGKPSDSAEALALSGFMETRNGTAFQEVPCHHGDPELKAHTEAVERSDAVILIGGKEGTYAAGLSALLRRKVIITIPAFGGSAKDLCEISEINNGVVNKLRNLDTSKSNWVRTLTEAITAEINSHPRILIVHGRGDDGAELRKAIKTAGAKSGPLKGLPEPLIMNLSGRGAVSVPEVFEQFASKVSATIAIVTADDVGGFARRDGRGDESRESNEPPKSELPATELRLAPRARENVWVEVGWFWGRLGRRHIFLWLKDDVPLPSDLQGAAWSKGNFNRAWPEIQDFIVNLR